MAYRVVVCGTGITGAHAIAGVDAAPDLELVGVWVSSAEKEGRDAGELAGGAKNGIPATRDMESLVALKPDCIIYCGSSDTRPMEALKEYEGWLRAGINVVATGPQVASPIEISDFAAFLDDACAKGGTSIWVNGIEPGFSTETLPLSLTGLSKTVDSVHVMEIFNYFTYDRPDGLYPLGFGLGPDVEIEIERDGALKAVYGGSVRTIAAATGMELDSIEQEVERAYAHEDIAAGVTIKKGQGAGCRFRTIGRKDGRNVIVLEHVTRMADDIAPDWPQPSGNSGCYRVIIKGEPNFKVDFEMVDDHGDLNAAACLATSMRIVNAVSHVVEAKPGRVCGLHLPLLTLRRTKVG